MATFSYRALTQAGRMVSGEITAASEAEVAQRIEFLDLVPVETRRLDDAARRRGGLFLRAPRPADVTLFTRDLALLLRAGARLDEALELLATDKELGRMRGAVQKVRADVHAGSGFAEAIAAQPALFAPIYVALVRVGEASGSLDTILDLLARERMRAEEVRRKLVDALQYPVFVLLAAGAVLVFFLLFVLPQFSSVLRDMGATLDPVVEGLLDLSDVMQARSGTVAVAAVAAMLAGWAVLRRPAARAALFGWLARLPLVRTIVQYRRSAMFCRNLSILLGNGVTLTAALRIIIDVMAADADAAAWAAASDRVRHGGRLSEAFAEGEILPPMALRMLRLGEETGQLALLSGRIADFYEEKLQRALSRVVAVIGPAAIVGISVVVGGLIVSVMTALLSVSQSIG